jgi:phospholipid-binding lipoprotein MlaA
MHRADARRRGRRRLTLWATVAALTFDTGGALLVPMASARPMQSVTAPVPGERAPAAAPRPPMMPVPHATRTPGDPFEATNRRFFKAQNGVDRAFFRPIALFFKRIVPRPVRDGLRNIIRNLNEPIVFLNDMLQLKPKRAIKTLTRFVLNSTMGIGGTIDVARTADLPRRKNGFGNTLARYGVRPGPYLYLPLIGPTTVRDLFGGQVDALVLPVGVGFPFNRIDYTISRGAVSTLDTRAEADGDLNALLASAADPYATLRSVYLQNRAAEIADIMGKSSSIAPLYDPLTDPAPETPVAGELPAEAPSVATPIADDVTSARPAAPVVPFGGFVTCGA